MGNYKDATLESSLPTRATASMPISTRRARRASVLAEQVNGTLATVAKDVKVQVEFNPRGPWLYRLIGYENRLRKQEDFNNDRDRRRTYRARPHRHGALRGRFLTREWNRIPVDAEIPEARRKLSSRAINRRGVRPLAGDKPRPRKLRHLVNS